jgi:hypothetical protein
MASYRDKINQRKLSTESGRIAFAIELLEHNYKICKDWRKDLSEHKPVEIYDGIYIYKDTYVWVISTPVDYKPNRYYVEVVPIFSNHEVMRDVLDAQPWQYW